MKVLVTGGAGFIGANFLNLLVPRHPEHDFVNLDKLTYAANLASLASIAELPNYRFLRADIADSEALQAAFDEVQPELVVHFAAESHVDRSIRGPREFVRTNIEGTFNLLEECRARWSGGEGHFHHVSTDEVHGSLGETGSFNEETNYDPSSPYSASKAASDHLVRAHARTYGMRVTISNCSNNYGPYQFPEKLVPLMILNALDRKPLPVYGGGQQVRDWLHVVDHCEAIWTVINEGRVGETYHVGGNEERRNLDLVKELCHVVAEESEADPGELLALITHVEDRPGHDYRYAIDASKIRKECGWTPRHALADGLRETVRWYREHVEWVEQVRSGDYRRWMEEHYGQV